MNVAILTQKQSNGYFLAHNQFFYSKHIVIWA